MKPGVDPLIAELGAALLATTALGVGIALAFWLVTGISPWPMVVLGEIAGLGFGVSLLTLTSPRRRP